MAFYLSKIRLNGNTYNLKDTQARTDIDHLPEWSRQSTKPTYTAAEVGALPDTYIAPVTSVNGQTGDVTIIEDDKTWNGIALDKTVISMSNNSCRIPMTWDTANETTAKMIKASKTPAANNIALYDASSYLSSTTPSANDNSTKVATTAYVDAAIPENISDLNNDIDIATLNDIPENITDLVNDVQVVILDDVPNFEDRTVAINNDTVSFDDLNTHYYYKFEGSNLFDTVIPPALYKVVFDAENEQYTLLSLDSITAEDLSFVPVSVTGILNAKSQINNTADNITIYHKEKGTIQNQTGGKVSTILINDDINLTTGGDINLTPDSLVKIGTTNNYIDLSIFGINLSHLSDDNGKRINGLADLHSLSDGSLAANKNYVDNKATLKTTAGSDNTEYNLLGTETSNTNTSAVNIYNPGSISFAKTTNEGRLTIGTSSLPGKIRLYSNVTNATGYTDLVSGATSTNTRTITFPDASGTVALTTDIPSVPSWAIQSSKPSYAFSELTSHPTTINDYGITDAYTKTEVDGLVSGVLHYKGTKADTSALPSSGNAIGDVWHITADGSEWAWDGTEWQELGSTVDLSGYLQTGDIAAWAKASTKPSYTASEVGALPSTTTYVSTFNGQSGAITYVAPVTSVNGQTGAVTIAADDKTWNGIELDKVGTTTATTYYIPARSSTTATTAYQAKATDTPEGNRIAVYANGGYLKSTTPSANDNSTKVATTAYVDSAVSGITHPVTSVNSKTGDVTLTASDVGAVKSSSSGANGFGSISNGNGAISMSESDAMTGSAQFTMNGPTVVLSSTKDLNNSSITFKTNSVNNIVLSEGTTTITGVVTPTADTMAANKKYVDDAVANASGGSSVAVTQTLTSGTAIGSVNGTTLYAPAAYDDTALAARVTALENIPWVTYYTGTSEPSSSQGQNGDIYLQTD